MLGWEFPPVFSGGLGVVTKNIAGGLRNVGVDLTLLLPKFIRDQVEEIGDPTIQQIIDGDSTVSKEVISRLRKIEVPTSISSPYISETKYSELFESWTEFSTNQSTTKKPKTKSNPKNIYGETLLQEVDRFAVEVVASTEGQDFDVIHAHDWITAEAGLQLKWKRNIPLVLQIHATEVDRTGNMNPDSDIFHREKYAMENADKIIAVSNYTKNILQEVYKIPGDKIEVVHNVYTKEKKYSLKEQKAVWKKDKSQFWVLFIGRVTLQKGPDYFIDVARKVIEKNKNIHFIVAGDGDMMGHMVSEVAEHNLHENVHFLGFISSYQRDALYRFTDCCVMPSISEPFGLTAAEVASYRTPLIVSKTCGANEVILHKLPVDFWDTDQMAEYVLALQKYPALRRFIRNYSKDALPSDTWEDKCREMVKIYESVSN